MDEPYFDEATGYWIGPEIRFPEGTVIVVQLPDPTPEAGWPADDWRP